VSPRTIARNRTCCRLYPVLFLLIAGLVVPQLTFAQPFVVINTNDADFDTGPRCPFNLTP